MKKILVVLAVSFALCGCVSPKQASVETCPDAAASRMTGLYFADHEEPVNPYNKKYKIYLMFIDDTHFTWWRTEEDPAQVIKRLDYYTHDHPGVTKYTTYTMTGNSISGIRKMHYEKQPNVRDYTFIQGYEGRFESCHLLIQQNEWYEYPDDKPSKTLSVQWKMVRVPLP